MNLKNHSPRRGVSLIELTVVISMIISLISALFVSARYYRDSASQSACITQIAQIQKAVRSYQNLNGLSAGDSIAESDFIGDDKAMKDNVYCPKADGPYTLLGEVPVVGVAFARCREYDRTIGTIDKSQEHTPPDLTSW